MTPSCHRTFHRGAENISREEHQSVPLSVIPQRPLISEIVEHGSPLGHINGLGRLGLQFERLHAIDIVEVQDIERCHTLQSYMRRKPRQASSGEGRRRRGLYSAPRKALRPGDLAQCACDQWSSGRQSHEASVSPRNRQRPHDPTAPLDATTTGQRPVFPLLCSWALVTRRCLCLVWPPASRRLLVASTSSTCLLRLARSQRYDWLPLAAYSG